MSYNIAALPLPVGVDHDRYREIGRILARRRADGTAPHIVALQEAFHGRATELIRTSGYPYVVRGPSMRLPRANSGLFILSEFSARAAARTVFSRCKRFDCFTRKGAVVAAVDLPGASVPIEIADTHLNSDPEWDFWATARECLDVRLSQVQELRELLDTRPSDSLLIFPGDFNFRPDDPDYLSFLSFTGLRDAAFECEGCGSDGGRSVDRQFFRETPGISIRPVSYTREFTEEMGGKPLSDHSALTVEYEIDWTP